MRKYFWKDREGKELSVSEFLSRFKEGVINITPYQQVKTQVVGTRISLIGIILGLGVSIYGYKYLWWVAIILVGALINTGVSYLSQVQQRNRFREIENQFKVPESKAFIQLEKEGLIKNEKQKRKKVV